MKKAWDIYFYNFITVLIIFFLPLFHLTIHKANDPSLIQYLYYIAALVAQYFCFALIFGLPLTLVSLFKARWLLRLVCTVIFSLFFILYIIDYKIFDFFNMHINSIVVDIVSTPSGRESLGIQLSEILLFFVGLIVTLFTFYKILTKIENSNFLILKKRKHFWGLFFAFLLIDKITFAYGHLFNHQAIVQVQRVVPIHQPLSVRKFARKHFNYNAEDYLRLKPSGASLLNYPRKDYNFQIAESNKLNVLFIIIDCFRQKSLTEEITPNLFKEAQKALRFNNHFSGGNGTRDGFFSLYYSLPGPYWKSFLAEKQTPLFVDMLHENGFEQKIFAARPLSFPDFRSTIYSKYDKKDIVDNYQGASKDRDKNIIRDLNQNLNEAVKNKTSFKYTLFLDSAHSRYSFDESKAKFKPFIGDYSYSTISKEEVEVGLYNRYRNALHYLDHQLVPTFKILNESGLLENTIVVVTGDHGEEFHEHGFVGHTGAFTREQTQVPMLIFHPHLKQQDITKWTHHFDVVPSLMNWMGLDFDKEQIGIGHNMLNHKGRDYIFSCSWDRCSIMDSEGWVLFGAPGFHPQLTEYRDINYNIINNVTAARKEKTSKYFREVLTFMSRFYK